MGIAHLALQFRARHKGCHRVDHQHVDGAGSHQRVADFQGLFTGIGLADEQVVDVHAEFAGIERIERVLRIDEGAGAAAFLRLGDRVQGQRGLARAFRPVHLDDASARQAAHAQRDIQAQRA